MSTPTNPRPHRHRAVRTIDRGYVGPVAWPENRAAHGNIVEIATCRCGAERRTNINGPHVERGQWIEPTSSTRREVQS